MGDSGKVCAVVVPVVGAKGGRCGIVARGFAAACRAFSFCARNSASSCLSFLWRSSRCSSRLRRWKSRTDDGADKADRFMAAIFCVEQQFGSCSFTFGSSLVHTFQEVTCTFQKVTRVCHFLKGDMSLLERR